MGSRVPSSFLSSCPFCWVPFCGEQCSWQLGAREGQIPASMNTPCALGGPIGGVDMPAPSFQRCCVVCLKMPFIPERWVRPLNVSSRPLPLGVQLPHSILGALPIWTMIINLFLVWMIPKNLETMPPGSQGSCVQLPNDTSN